MPFPKLLQADHQDYGLFSLCYTAIDSGFSYNRCWSPWNWIFTGGSDQAHSLAGTWFLVHNDSSFIVSQNQWESCAYTLAIRICNTPSVQILPGKNKLRRKERGRTWESQSFNMKWHSALDSWQTQKLYIVFKCLFWKEDGRAEWKRDRQISICWLTPSNGYTSHDWARQKPGSRN